MRQLDQVGEFELQGEQIQHFQLVPLLTCSTSTASVQTFTMATNGTSVPFTNLIIGADIRPASSGKFFEVRNPYSEEIVGHAASATSEDCRQAIESCGKAFPQWEQTPHSERRAILLKAAELLKTERYLSRILATTREETAAPEHVLKFTAMGVGRFLEIAATMADELSDETVPFPGGYTVFHRRAIGVVYVARILAVKRALILPQVRCEPLEHAGWLVPPPCGDSPSLW